MQKGGQFFGTATLRWMADQRLAHARRQQAVAPVLQHGEGQGALQHLLQGLLVAPERQRQIARVKVDPRHALLKQRGSREEHPVEIAMGWRLEWELGAQQGDARVDQPAGQPMDVAQHRNQTELAQWAQIALLGDAQARTDSAGRQVQRDVVGDQGVVTTPAFERHAQVRCTDRRARQHAVAAPR